MSEQKMIPITIFQAPCASLMERGLYLKMHDYDHPFCGTVPAEYYNSYCRDQGPIDG